MFEKIKSVLRDETATTAAIALMGSLIGLLVVGVIGIFVGQEVIDSAALTNTDTLYTSQTAIIEAFQTGVTFMKVVVIVAAAGIVFLILQQVGILPRFGWQSGGGGAM